MLTDDELIAGLRQYISKNKAIPDFFHRLNKGSHPRDALCLLQLKTALAEFDPTHDIFSNPYCSVYLLYLIEQKQIPFWQGITVYGYCMALMQFTDKQALREGDERYHVRQSVDVHALMKDGIVTPVGEQYLNSIEAQYAAFPMLRFNREYFLSEMAKRASVDQWLIQVKYQGHSSLPAYLPAKTTILDDVLYVARDHHDFIIPSFSMMQLLHQMQCREPMTFKPILGVISRETVLSFHEQGIHPLSLYSPLVKNNLMKVHQFDCGPFFVMLHDVAHCLMANLLQNEERHQVLSVLAPQLKRRAAEMQGYKKREAALSAIDRVIFEWGDFNFSKIKSIPSQRSEWMMFYLLSAFGRYQWENDFRYGLYASEAKAFFEQSALSLVDDDLLYCLGVMANEGEVWRALFDRMYALAETRRNPEVLTAIMAAVEASQPKRMLGSLGLFPSLKKPETDNSLLPSHASAGHRLRGCLDGFA